MTWRIKDEWVDLAQARHVRILHNPDTNAEHQLIYEFGVWKCHHCGHPKDTPLEDFNAHTTRVLATLNEDHQKRIAVHMAKHPNVRKGTGPKK